MMAIRFPGRICHPTIYHLGENAPHPCSCQSQLFSTIDSFSVLFQGVIQTIITLNPTEATDPLAMLIKSYCKRSCCYSCTNKSAGSPKERKKKAWCVPHLQAPKYLVSGAGCAGIAIKSRDWGLQCAAYQWYIINEQWQNIRKTSFCENCSFKT